MQAWEYTVLTLDLWTETSESGRQLADREPVLAEIGTAGWELVTVVPLALPDTVESAGTTHERWVFKRPMNADGVFPVKAEAVVEPEPAVGSEPGDPPPLSQMKEVVDGKRDDHSY